MKLVTWSLGHSVTRSLGHSVWSSGHQVIWSSGHPIIQSSSHPVIQCSHHPVIFNITTDGRTNNIRTSRSASQTNMRITLFFSSWFLSSWCCSCSCSWCCSWLSSWCCTWSYKWVFCTNTNVIYWVGSWHGVGRSWSWTYPSIQRDDFPYIIFIFSEHSN